MFTTGCLAARGESLTAVGRRCIPTWAALGVVHDGSNTPGILPPRALRGGRFAGLDATRDFHHGLLGDGGPTRIRTWDRPVMSRRLYR